MFQLEEGEILAEPMPNRARRASGFLLYEATEGGAGVLTRLVGEPERLAEVARKALSIMHFDVDGESRPRTLADVPDTACVAACYRCLMSYYNQPDHELLDRRDEGARASCCASRARPTSRASAPRPRPQASTPRPQPEWRRSRRWLDAGPRARLPPRTPSRCSSE